MILDPFNALGNALVKTFVTERHFQMWLRLIASLLASSLVALFGIWGLSIPVIYANTHSASVALLLGFALGLVSGTSTFVFAWQHNPLTKQIPLMFPTQIQIELQKQMVEQGGMVTINPQEKEK